MTYTSYNKLFSSANGLSIDMTFLVKTKSKPLARKKGKLLKINRFIY